LKVKKIINILLYIMSEQQNNYKTPQSSPRDPVCPPAPRKDEGSYGQEMTEEDLEFLRRNGIEVQGQINNPGSNGGP
jgi:hypothetical protein